MGCNSSKPLEDSSDTKGAVSPPRAPAPAPPSQPLTTPVAPEPTSTQNGWSRHQQSIPAPGEYVPGQSRASGQAFVPSPNSDEGHKQSRKESHTSSASHRQQPRSPQVPVVASVAAVQPEAQNRLTVTQFANLAPPSPRSLASEQPHRDTTPSPVPSASDAHSVAPSPGPLTPGAWSEAELASMDLTRRVKKNSTIHSKSGGFSDVYIGTLQPEGLKIAIKALRAAHMGDTEAESKEGRERIDKRLKRELRIWMPLKSDRIVPCLGFAKVDNLPCLISPWYENGNAKEYLTKHPDCNKEAMVIQVAEGLVFLHLRKVVHYDIKAMNILIDDQGQARLTDFGIAKILEDVRTGYTTTNDTIHAARISSPEALAGGDRTAKSDVYSFACFALEVMTQKAPFYKIKNSAAIITKKVVAGAMPQREDFPELPYEDPLWPLLERCWDMEPDNRPDMNEVLATLRSLGYRA